MIELNTMYNMNIKEGKTYYFYDDRAVEDVCKAHVLHILPHPERQEDRLIVYRWYGKHKQHWWYGVTCFRQQEIWADYVKEAIRLRQARKRKIIKDVPKNNFLPKPVR